MRAPPLLLVIATAPCGAFTPSRRRMELAQPTLSHPGVPWLRVARASVSTNEPGRQQPSPAILEELPPEISLEADASSGIEFGTDLPLVLDAVASLCDEYGLPLDVDNVKCDELPAQCQTVPGALGRVLLLRVRGLPGEYDLDEDEFWMQLKMDLSERIDTLLMGGAEKAVCSYQPILLSFRPQGDNCTIAEVIEKEAMEYGLRDEVSDFCSTEDETCFVHPMAFEINCYPSSFIKIDGAMVDTIEKPGEAHFDTSSVLVFDKLMDDKLRRRLLNIVKGYPEDHSGAEGDWDDIENGPDPTRWVRGGLTDVVAVEQNEACWGLRDEGVTDICDGNHPAIAEFESRIINLFPDFVVSRLPEAVLGGCVSPLTANAPTHGDSFDYHIDADPMQVPPSPWADVFGRYPNRSRGKPRFVSCLAYLSEDWDAAVLGAPTRFRDPPTGETIDVLPRPGRCVVMDQDVSHTVTAPEATAGRRPRYSLVWKLVLHPRGEGGDVDLACGRGSMWPEPTIVGSAREESPL